MIYDRIGVPVKVGDLVYIWDFNRRGIVIEMDKKYAKIHIPELDKDSKSERYTTTKQGSQVLNLTLTKEAYPELFL